MSDLADSRLEPYETFEEWLAEGHQLADRLEKQLQLEFLTETIDSSAGETGELAIGPFVASLASALQEGTELSYFGSLSEAHKLRILRAAELSLMRLSMAMQKELNERMAQSVDQ